MVAKHSLKAGAGWQVKHPKVLWNVCEFACSEIFIADLFMLINAIAKAATRGVSKNCPETPLWRVKNWLLTHKALNPHQTGKIFYVGTI